MAKSTPINILKPFILPAFSFVALMVAYAPTLFWMFDRWFESNSYYSHGVIIPFVSIYLIWSERHELSRVSQKQSSWGLRLVLIALAIHILSSMLRVYFTSGFSLILAIIGLIMHFWGSRVMRFLFFPIFFLLFMVPLPLVSVVNISFYLKMMAAKIAVFVLNNMRIQTVQDGSVILMPHAKVVVDDLCSGLRSLIALLALGAVFAHWLKGSHLKKIILFLCAIPIAVITNVVRIIFLSLVNEIWGAQYATGFIHDLSGFIVFAVAFLLLHWTIKILE